MLLQPFKHCDHCCAPAHQGHICLFRYLTFVPPHVANCLLLFPALMPHNCRSFGEIGRVKVLLPTTSGFLPSCHTIVDLLVELASSRYCCQRLAASWRSPPGTWVVASSQLVPPTTANGWPLCRIASEAHQSVPILLVSRLATPECSTCHSGMGGNARHKRIAASELGTKWRPNLLMLLLLLLLPVLLLLLFLQQQLLPLLLLLLTTN